MPLLTLTIFSGHSIQSDDRHPFSPLGNMNTTSFYYEDNEDFPLHAELNLLLSQPTCFKSGESKQKEIRI